MMWLGRLIFAAVLFGLPTPAFADVCDPPYSLPDGKLSDRGFLNIPIGGARWFIYRQSDQKCIGKLSWAVVPDPVPTLRLKAGWCGDENCKALELTSTPSRTMDWTRFFERDKPDAIIVRIEDGPDGPGKHPIAIVSPDGRTLASFENHRSWQTETSKE
ncbi:MAG: hypothetical protein AAGE61_12590 [Pseudomonadota bacterium]